MNRAEQLKYQLMRELKLRNYADSSIRTYVNCIMVFFAQHKKFNSYQSIEDIKSYLLQFNNQNYHKQMVAAIHRFYEFIVKKPLSLKDIPYPRPTHYLPQILSVQEVHAMISAITNLKQKAYMQLMYSCALRIGEVVNIMVHHVDGQRKLILVKGAKGFKDRYVPLPAATIELLRSYYKDYKPKQYLFEGQFSEQYSVRSIQQVFHRAIKATGIIKKVTPHCLRHSRLTHLKEAGVDIYELKEIAGHSQIKTTEIYLHLAKETLVNRVAQADIILSSALKNQLTYA